MKLQEKIRKLIATNHLGKALKILADWARTHGEEDMLFSINLLQNNFKVIDQKETRKTLSIEDAMRHKGAIAESVYKILRELPTKAPPSEGTPEKLVQQTEQTILFLASQPTDEGRLELEKEFSQIHNRLQESPIKWNIFSKWAVRATDLQQEIQKYKPQIIHFSGHGIGGDEISGGIFVENAQGKAHLVPGKALDIMFKIVTQKIKIDVVVLNACYSHDQSVTIAKHVAWVVGMNDQMDDGAAIAFSIGFYSNLALGNNVPDAFDLGVNLIRMEGLEDEEVPVLLKGEKH